MKNLVTQLWVKLSKPYCIYSYNKLSIMHARTFKKGRAEKQMQMNKKKTVKCCANISVNEMSVLFIIHSISYGVQL